VLECRVDVDVGHDETKAVGGFASSWCLIENGGRCLRCRAQDEIERSPDCNSEGRSRLAGDHREHPSYRIPYSYQTDCMSPFVQDNEEC
jgi:hypothetical protein